MNKSFIIGEEILTQGEYAMNHHARIFSIAAFLIAYMTISMCTAVSAENRDGSESMKAG